MINAIDDDPLALAREWARNLARNVSPSSVAAMKKQLLAASASSLGEAVEASSAAMRTSFSGPDLAEAMTAKREGRPPNFTGGNP